MLQQYTKISHIAVAALKKNNRAVGRLMIEFNRGADTIGNWIRDMDARLTTPNSVRIISEETGLSETEILETFHSPIKECA